MLTEHVTAADQVAQVKICAITLEALLTVMIDYLRSLQAAERSCLENTIALGHLEDGLLWLQRGAAAREKSASSASPDERDHTQRAMFHLDPW
jgi:hypothetical protein